MKSTNFIQWGDEKEQPESTMTVSASDDKTLYLQACTYCGNHYPYPVSLHHDEAECLNNQKRRI